MSRKEILSRLDVLEERLNKLDSVVTSPCCIPCIEAEGVNSYYYGRNVNYIPVNKVILQILRHLNLKLEGTPSIEKGSRLVPIVNDKE